MHNGLTERHNEYPNWRTRIIAWLINVVTGSPKTVVICAVIVSAISAWYASKNLILDANTDSLISPDRAFMQKYAAYCKEFGDLEYLYVAVDAKGNPAAAKTAVNELKLALESLADLPGVYARIDGDEQWRLAPRAMSTSELKSLLTAADGFQPLLENADSSLSAFSVLNAADERLRRLLSNGLSMNVEERERLGAGTALLMSAVSAQPNDGFLFAQERQNEYLVSSSGNMFFIEIFPRKDFSGLGTIEPVLAKIRDVISQVQSHSPSVDIGLTGKPVLQADELITTSQDMTRGTLVAAMFVMIFTMWTFGSLVRPILASVTLALTFACTYGAATLFVGRLNLLSLVFMLVLVSAGVDYGIHTIARYTEFRQKLGTFRAMRSAMAVNTIPTWVGALTSAAVFFLALGTEFGGLRELGIIAGSGLLICVFMMTLVLPALIVLVDGWREKRAKSRGVSEITSTLQIEPPLSSSSARSPRMILVSCGIVTIVLCSFIPLMKFESNLLKLQAEGLDSIQWEHRILEDSLSASWFGAVICRTEAQVTTTVERAQAQPLVAEVHSVLDLVAPDSAERIELRSKLAAALSPMKPASSALGLKANPVQQQELTGAFVESVRNRLEQMLALASLQAHSKELAPLRKIAEALLQLERKLNDPQQRLAAQVQAQAMVAHTGNALKQMGIGANAGLRESLPLAVRSRFVSPEGGMLVSIFPKEDLWEFNPLESFVKTLRTIDPNATGAPMTVFESIIDMRSAFILMSTWSVLAITLLVWLDLRSVVSTAICMACLLVSMSWTFGLLGLLGVSLNLANFFSVPMLLGFGIDSSVHVMHRAREQGSTRAFGWTKRAVILSAVTTAVGFGTLLFASHRGLQSLGWIMFLGSFSCLICAVMLLPAALRVFPKLISSTGKTPANTN